MAKFPNFMRVVTNSKTQTVEINRKIETEVIFDRTSLKIIELLAQALKFSYALIPAGKIDIGRRLSNGSWTGMIGLVQRNEADMAIGTLSETVQRHDVVDFSYPYNRVRVTFATRKPEYTPDFLALVSPFSLDVWLYAIATLLILPVVCFVLFDKKYPFTKLIFDAYKTIVYQPATIEPTTLREYILLAFWQLGAVFFIFCYSAVLLSFLTIPKLSGIRTVSELAAGIVEGKYQCITYPGAFLSRVLLQSDDEKDRIIGRNLLQKNGTRDIETALRTNVLKKKPVFVGSDIDLLPYKSKYFISEDELIPTLRSIALQKNFCCRRQLDRIIVYVWASGIFEKLKQDHMFIESMRLEKRSSDSLKKHEVRPLSIEDLAGAFILNILGCVLAIVVFIVELIVGKRCTFLENDRKKRNHRNLRQQKLLCCVNVRTDIFYF